MADPNGTRLRYDSVSTFVLVPQNHPRASREVSPMPSSGTQATFTIASPMSSPTLPSCEAHHSSAIMSPSYYTSAERLPGIYENSELRPQYSQGYGPVQFMCERSVSHGSSSSSQNNVTIDVRGRERRRRDDDHDERVPRKFRSTGKRRSQSSYREEDDDDGYCRRFRRSRSKYRSREGDTNENGRGGRSRTKPHNYDEDGNALKKKPSGKSRSSQGKKKPRVRNLGSENLDADVRQQRRSNGGTGSLVEINESDNGVESEASIVVDIGAVAEPKRRPSPPSALLELPAPPPAPAPSGPLAGICGFFASLLRLRPSERSVPQAPQTVIIMSPPPPPPQSPPPESETPSSSPTEEEPELLYEVCRLDQRQLRMLCSNIDLKTVVKQELDEQEEERERREFKEDRKRRKRMRRMRAEERRRAVQEERGKVEIEEEAQRITEESAQLKDEDTRKAEEWSKPETMKEGAAIPPKVDEMKLGPPKPDDVKMDSPELEEPPQAKGKVEELPPAEEKIEAAPKPAGAGAVSPSSEGGLGAPLQVDVPVVFVFGGPGSGRGTQCAKLVDNYGFMHISSGDLLRAEVIAGTDRGKEIYQVMQKADLVPLDYVICLLKEAIESALETAKGYLIDGYPRNVAQAERFEKEVCRCTNILYFEVSDETMAKRILERGKTSGRVEDKAELVKHRLDIFHSETEPVLERYKDVLFKVNAEDDPQHVFESVIPFFDAITKK